MVKQGDKFPVTFTVNHNITGAAVRLIVRHLAREGAFEALDHTVSDAENGVITHTLDGTWAVGKHYLELEITQSGETRTAPTTGQCVIRIDRDLDQH